MSSSFHSLIIKIMSWLEVDATAAFRFDQKSMDAFGPRWLTSIPHTPCAHPTSANVVQLVQFSSVAVDTALVMSRI